MSAAQDLQALAEAFNEATGLNQEALAVLHAGTGLDGLEPLFHAKQAVNEKLERLQSVLGAVGHDPALAPGLSQALEAQAQAARTEAQLSEALAKLVSLSGKVKSAYQQKHEKSSGKGWEVAG